MGRLISAILIIIALTGGAEGANILAERKSDAGLIFAPTGLTTLTKGAGIQADAGFLYCPVSLAGNSGAETRFLGLGNLFSASGDLKLSSGGEFGLFPAVGLGLSAYYIFESPGDILAGFSSDARTGRRLLINLYAAFTKRYAGTYYTAGLIAGDFNLFFNMYGLSGGVPKGAALFAGAQTLLPGRVKIKAEVIVPAVKDAVTSSYPVILNIAAHDYAALSFFISGKDFDLLAGLNYRFRIYPGE